MDVNMNTNGGLTGAENATGLNNREGNADNNAAANGGTGDSSTPKTYTEKELQSETDRRVTEALKTAQSKWVADYEKKLKSEKDEAARLAKMSAEERAQAEFEKERKEFERERESHNKERLEFECTKQLAAESLPVEFASMLTGADADATKKNIKTFKDAFAKAVEVSVKERLKGKTPNLPGNTEAETDAFLSGFGK